LETKFYLVVSDVGRNNLVLNVIDQIIRKLGI
jgi:hypothetical protein